MKGVVFTVFNQLVEETFGIDQWESLLDQAQPESGGIYTTGGNYPDQELLNLVATLSKDTNIPIDDLIKTYGEYLLAQLSKLYPDFFNVPSLKDFLLSIHDTIHVEVKKLYPDADLPSFTYEDPGPDSLVMLYRSKRRLPALAEGLIRGASQHFKTPVDINISHYEDDEIYDRFELTFKG